MTRLSATITGGLACLALSACAGAPRQRPLPTKPIAQGADTLEAARRALQGQWRLESLTVAGADGRALPIDAAGRMELDDFGNLTIEYRMSEAGIKALESVGLTPPNPVISTSGQAAIDPTQHRITYVPPDVAERAFDPKLAAARANPFALERIRYYTLDGDVLTLATRHDNGRDAATSRWKRMP